MDNLEAASKGPAPDSNKRIERIVTVIAVIVSFAPAVLLIAVPKLSWENDGHPHYRGTLQNVEWWHDLMRRFREMEKRNPSSLEELQRFARRTCEHTNVSYEEVLHDGWGNKLRIALRFLPDEAILEVRSAGSNARFDEEDPGNMGDHWSLSYPNAVEPD